MEGIKNFIKTWGSFVALCLIAVALLFVFLTCEIKCDSIFLRILMGVVTMPLCGVTIVSAILSFSSAKMESTNNNS